MTTLVRLVGLWWSACRYGLHRLLPADAPWVARLIFWPAGVVGRRGEDRASCLRDFLNQQGPIFVKFGQLLSTRPDLLPEDMARELATLQDSVPPFSVEVFQEIVEAGLGDSIDALFTDFDPKPLASASLAQVHTARLPTGEEVVIKALRPGVHRRVERDLKVMHRLAALVDRMGKEGKRLHAPEVVADYARTIRRELDLQHEAANSQKLRDNFKGNPVNYTPEVYWDYVRQNLMVSERIRGIPVNDREAVLAQGTDLQRLAEIGVEIFFTQVFEHNFFHADMHPGNIFISSKDIENPQYISVDCAICGSLTDMERRSLAQMLIAVFRRDYRRVAEVQIRYGWVAPDTPVAEFAAEIRKVCEPIFAKPLSEISFADMLVSLFRTAREFDMQVMPSLVLLEKTIINIEGLGRQLYPELDLWATAQPFLEKWWKDQHSPRKLWKDLREKGPDYLEDLAALPALLREQLERDEESRQVTGAGWQPLGGALFLGSGLGLWLGSSTAALSIPVWAVPVLAVSGLWLLVRSR